METPQQAQPKGGGRGSLPEGMIDVFGDFSDLGDTISSDGAGSQRGESGDGVEVAAGGGGTADPTSGTPLGVVQSAGLGPPAANEQEAPHVQQEEAAPSSTAVKKTRNKWDFSKTHPGARYRPSIDKWMCPLADEGHGPTLLDDVSWDEEDMRRRAEANGHDLNSEKPDLNNEETGSEKEKPDSENEEPDSEKEKPDSESKELASATEKPYSENEKPASKNEEPESKTEKSPSENEEPTSVTEEPHSKAEEPDSVNKEPKPKTDEPNSENEGLVGQAGTGWSRMWEWVGLWWILVGLGFTSGMTVCACVSCVSASPEVEPEVLTRWEKFAEEFEELVNGPWV